MGTRADFYIRKEESMEYMGSIAWDGYEIDEYVLESKTEEDFRTNIQKFLSERDDSSTPAEHGWPWPWNDSRTTDYSYVFMAGKVWGSNWGYPLFDPLKPESEEDEQEDDQKLENFWPDMSPYKRVRMDKGSGLIVITSKR